MSGTIDLTKALVNSLNGPGTFEKAVGRSQTAEDGVRQFDGKWYPVAGWVVWDGDEGGRFQGAYRGRIYPRREKAQEVLESVVWHSRDRMSVREVLVLPPTREPPSSEEQPSEISERSGV
jgi:hypothetical protein